MQGIIFVAPPAAGKGTQADLVEERFGYEHISTGDLLREESHKDTLEGLYINEKLANGEFVDDDLISELLEKKLSKLNKNFILDGYPRDIEQAERLGNMLHKLNIDKLFVIYIDIDEETAKKRIIGRLQCPNCKKVYNNLIDELKPTSSDTCDDCHILLEKRTDDNEETFKERFNLYLEETKLLIDFFESRNLLYRVDGKKNKDEIFDDIEKILGSGNYD